MMLLGESMESEYLSSEVLENALKIVDLTDFSSIHVINIILEKIQNGKSTKFLMGKVFLLKTIK